MAAGGATISSIGPDGVTHYPHYRSALPANKINNKSANNLANKSANNKSALPANLCPIGVKHHSTPTGRITSRNTEDILNAEAKRSAQTPPSKLKHLIGDMLPRWANARTTTEITPVIYSRRTSYFFSS